MTNPVSEPNVKRGVVLLFASASGCLPVVTHSPQLETGYTGGVIVGYETEFDPPISSQDSIRETLPYAGFYVTRSYVDTTTDWGMSVGLAMKMLLSFQADIFIRPPRADGVPFDAGVGSIFFISAMGGFVPYAQIGFPLTESAYIYTTQGATFLARTEGKGFNHPWMSVLSVDWGVITAQMGAMFGDMDNHRSSYSPWRPPRYFVQFLVRRKLSSFPFWRPPRPRF